MIDWTTLVSVALHEAQATPETTPESCLLPPKSGNKQELVATKHVDQVIENKVDSRCVATMPTVATPFEELRGGTASSAWIMPGDGVVEEVLAPVKKRGVRPCRTCCYRRRPGLSDGYCGGDRVDLPLAYGLYHPLHQLPVDNGATCEVWK